MLDGFRFVGMPSCVTWQCGDIVLYVVSGMMFSSAPVSRLQMSWFVHNRSFPFGLVTHTHEFTQSVGRSTFAMMETEISVALVPVYPQCYWQSPVCLFQAGRNIIHSG